MNPDEINGEDPLLALKRLKAAQAPDPLERLKALRPTQPNIHDEYKSGRLANRMSRENTNDRELAAAEDSEAQPGIAGSLADATQGIPGVGALQAGARSIVRGQSYRDAYNDIRGQTDKVPASAKTIGRVAAGIPAIASIPGGGMLSGAIWGGADQALGADPDKGIGSRAATGLAGAATGALLGKAGEVIGLVPRLIRSPTSGANIIARQAARGAAANTGYATSIAEGQGKTGTSAAIAHWLKQPDIAQIQQDLLATRQFAGKAPDSPEVLDGIYKVLSDHQQQLERGLESASPTRPNTGRFRSDDISLAKQEGLDAMSGGASMPGPMPTYRPTVQNFAKASGDIKGLETGQDALRHSLNKGVTTGKNIDATTKEAFARWAQNPNTAPSAAQAASEGVIGAAKEDFFKHPLPNVLGRRAVSNAPGLLRATGASSQPVFDMLTKLGLLGANAARQ